MWIGGDQAQGYEIDVDRPLRLVVVRCWGIWEMSTAERYRSELVRAFAPFDGGRPWYLVADISDYPPQRPEVARVHRMLMQRATKQGLRRAASVVNSAMTQLQIRRVASEGGVLEHGCHEAMSSALNWLMSDAHLTEAPQGRNSADRAPMAPAPAH